MFPGYDGPRPKMQIWHGSADSTLAPANYQETIKQVRRIRLLWAPFQLSREPLGALLLPNYARDTEFRRVAADTVIQWTNVFGVSQTPTSSVKNFPQANYQTDNYGDNVQGIYATGVGHSVPSNLTASEQWFGL